MLLIKKRIYLLQQLKVILNVLILVLDKDLFIKYKIGKMIVKNMFHDKKKLIKTGISFKIILIPETVKFVGITLRYNQINSSYMLR
jgi:hypothetical protein